MFSTGSWIIRWKKVQQIWKKHFIFHAWLDFFVVCLLYFNSLHPSIHCSPLEYPLSPDFIVVCFASTSTYLDSVDVFPRPISFNCYSVFICRCLVYCLWTLSAQVGACMSCNWWNALYWWMNKPGQSIPDVSAEETRVLRCGDARRCWNKMTAAHRHASAPDGRDQTGLGYLFALHWPSNPSGCPDIILWSHITKEMTHQAERAWGKTIRRQLKSL